MTRDGAATPACVFLDRDGVINRPAWDEADRRYESPLDAGVVELADGAAAAIAALQAAGWRTVVVSNQPAAAKGKATPEQLRAVHERVVALLADDGVTIEDWRYCFHHPQAVVADLRGPCDCRKPQPGMLLEAAAAHGIDLARSWMVGDSDADVGAGRAAGCRTLLVEEERSAHRRGAGPEPDARAGDLRAAVAVIGHEPASPVSLPER